MAETTAVLDAPDPKMEAEVVRKPLVLNQRTMGWIGNYISSIVEAKPRSGGISPWRSPCR